MRFWQLSLRSRAVRNAGLRRLLRDVLVVSAAVLSVGWVLGTASAAADGGSGSITLGGQVGPLSFNSSTATDVAAFAGQPEAVSTGNFGAVPADPDYLALGYGCQEHASAWTISVDTFDYCTTVFYINTWTQQLSAFWSASPWYSFRGASPGMSTLAAERHIDQRARGGYLSGFHLGYRGGSAQVVGDVIGGRIRKHHPWIVGGRLRDLALESNLYPVGLLFC